MTGDSAESGGPAMFWLRRAARRTDEAVQDNQWLAPVLGIGVGLALSLATPAEDGLADWAVTVGQARATLLTVLGLVFTALSIVLALASVAAQNVVGWFGARMLRIYNRRSGDRWVLATFAITASFILFEQYQMRGLESDATAPSAGLSVTLLLFALTGSVLIWYLNSLIRWFRVDEAVALVRAVAERTLRANRQLRRGTDPAAEMPARPAAAIDLRAPRSGYLADVDADSILAACGRADVVTVVSQPVGSAVVAGHPIGWIAGGNSPVDEGLQVTIIEAIDVSDSRELALSLEYGLVALVDIAVMALSPAVNDPTSAIEVIEQLEFLLTSISNEPIGPYVTSASGGEPCVAVSARTFGQLVELVTEQIVIYGASDPMVRRALAGLEETLRRLELSDEDRRYVDVFAADLASAAAPSQTVGDES